VADQHPRLTAEGAKVQADRDLLRTELHAVDEVKSFALPAGGGLEQPVNAINRDAAFPRGVGECSAISERFRDGLSQDSVTVRSAGPRRRLARPAVRAAGKQSPTARENQ
jgi:hypothetical protein